MESRHLTLDEIAALFDGRLEGRAKKAAEAHLKTGCPQCGAEAEEIRAALRALERYDLEPLPTAVAERALAAIRGLRARGSLVKRAGEALERIAGLVLDSSREIAPAGVRGAVAPVRQLVYEWEEDRFTLHIRRDDDESAYEIMGRIFSTEGDVAGVAIHLNRASGRGLTARADATGQFVFEGVRRGSYTVRIELPGGDVTLPGIELP